MKVLSINCDFCGRLYEKEEKYIRYNKKHGLKNYCCKLCVSLSRNKSFSWYCAFCGEPICVSHSRAKKSIKGVYFCCHSCATSYNNVYKCRGNHPNYKGGCRTYRDLALESLPNVCSVCNYDIVIVLEVHHKDGNRSNNDIENLDILCPTHHKEYKLGIRKYT